MKKSPDLRYPIGPFVAPKEIAAEQVRAWIADMESLPHDLRGLTGGMSRVQLDTPYRPGGWTVRQVVHHLPDSHMNGYVRFKWALTETDCTIKPYEQTRWAETSEVRVTSIHVSLDLLDALHRRWCALLRLLTPEQLKLEFHHPENGKVSLNREVALYAWHGRHHLAQIESLARREGWLE